MTFSVTGLLGSPTASAAGRPWLVVVVIVACLVVIAARWWVGRWRDRRPGLWWRVVGAPVALWRLGWTWRPLCESADLVAPSRGSGRYGVLGGRSSGGGLLVRGQPLRVVVPRRYGVRVTARGFTVLVRMLPGQVPDDYAVACEAMAHTWRVHQVSVSCPAPGRVALDAVGFDPLRAPAPGTQRTRRSAGAGLRAVGARWRAAVVWWLAVGLLRAVRPGPVAADGARAVLAVGVGVCQDGRAWVVDLARRPHHLVTGATQSGKSTLTVALVAALAPRPVALVGIDAKGGVELGPFTDRLSVLATTRAQAAGVLEALVDEVLDRMITCRVHGVRSVWDLPGPVRVSPVVVVVDEIAELFLHAGDRAGKEEVSRCVTGLVRLAQLGAAAGVHLWVAGQRFGSDLGPGATLLRAQLSGRICHRVTDTETATMTLAGLPVAAVEAALRIPVDLPGVAVTGDDTGAWQRVRSHPVPLDDAAVLVRRHADARVDLPALTAAVTTGSR